MSGLKPTLLIVEDEKHTREGLRRALADHFEVYLAPDLAGAENVLTTETVDLVLTDLRLGSDSGMDVLKRCQNLPHQPVCFMMTAYGSVENAVEAMRRGAQDYVTKPVNIDKLEMMLLRALRGRRVEVENRRLRDRIEKEHGLERFVGRSPRMVEIFETLRQVADTRATVLVQGESGTGKELVAQALHQLSSRKARPFLAVHCAALSAQLLESELFGHEKGAFTGAMERRTGRFEEADGGTIFLDEIGEIDATIQVKLLRVLGERSFERVGGNKRIQVDVRVIAATNRDLAAMVKEGTFREDLYYRINVVRIDLPPLRERTGDIALLARTFLEEFARENGKPGLHFSPRVEDMLVQYTWPGNVRQLRAAVEHGVVMCRGREILPGDLPPDLRSAVMEHNSPSVETLNLQVIEKHSIQQALQTCSGNRTEAARLLGISRRTLHRKLNEYQIGD
ncbi:MAG: sigma-54 dependent transcriptional regulator [Candidatus Methylacidiphilales bacterium]|nr:sigma-54 dependent transcriptional regulator [Candidatus Methylacidiphilales bacterium]